jgi:hypothetical protein
LKLLSKLLEIVIHSQLMKYLKKISFMQFISSAYSRNYSCETAMMHIVDDIQNSLNQKLNISHTLRPVSGFWYDSSQPSFWSPRKTIPYKRRSTIIFKIISRPRKFLSSSRWSSKQTSQTLVRCTTRFYPCSDIVFTLYTDHWIRSTKARLQYLLTVCWKRWSRSRKHNEKMYWKTLKLGREKRFLKLNENKKPKWLCLSQMEPSNPQH